MERLGQKIMMAQESDFCKVLKKVAEVKGYMIGGVWVRVCKSGFESLEFEIRPINRRSYTPDIYEKDLIHFESFNNNPQFKVQTASYGALDGEEMEEFMKAMNNGWEMQQYLNQLDWSKCPRIKIED
jgi:hypothetical protein